MSAINESVEQESALHESRTRPFHFASLKHLSDFSRKGKVQTLWHPSHLRITRIRNGLRHVPEAHGDSASAVPNLWQEDGGSGTASPQRQDRNGSHSWSGLEVDHIRLLCQIASNRPDIVVAVCLEQGIDG